MKIMTDSTADLPRETYEREEIGVVPLTIRLGARTWRDFFDVEADDYYATLRESTAFPATSQPSPQTFIDAYEPYATKGEPVLSIHISSKLSGTYQSAFLAKSHFPEATIEVIDSRQASLGLGMIVLLCKERARSGHSFEDVVDFGRDLARKVETYFSVDSLEYLKRGGRIGRAQSLLGTLMKVKPLLRLTDGEIHPLEKIRTTERLLNGFVELVEKGSRKGRSLRLSFAESDNGEIASGLLTRLMRIPGVSLVHRCKLGGVITSHAGPGALAISFVEA